MNKHSSNTQINTQRRQWLALVSDQGLECIRFACIQAFHTDLNRKGNMVMILEDHGGEIEWLAKFLNSVAKQSKHLAFQYFDRATQSGNLDVIGLRTGDPFQEAAIASFVEYEYGIHLN